MLKTTVKSNRATTIVRIITLQEAIERENKYFYHFDRILGAPILFFPTVLRRHESKSYK